MKLKNIEEKSLDSLRQEIFLKEKLKKTMAIFYYQSLGENNTQIAKRMNLSSSRIGQLAWWGERFITRRYEKS